MINCWTLKSKEADRSFGGNDGYPDELGIHYVFDNYVKNYQRVEIGDVVIIAGKKNIYGVARIENISIENQKPGIRYRCPICNIAEFYDRKGISPIYKCRNKHEFDIRKEENILKDLYTANYGSTFTPLIAPIETKILMPYFINYNKYYSIQQTQLTFITDRLAQAAHLLETPQTSVTIGIQDDPIPYIHDDDDKRKYAQRNIVIRGGQAAFRADLISYYGAKCMLTNCNTEIAVEACHINSYKGDNTNLISNGLLLRRDLHILFDKNLLGIHPETLTVTLHASLKNSHYQEFEGQKLQPLYNSCKSAAGALELRWQQFNDQPGL
jgi:hypothetical protein